MPIAEHLTQPIEPALESLLNRSVLRIEVVAELQQCGSWFMQAPRYECGLFHVAGVGDCLVECESLPEALHLQAGDMVLFPHGNPHCLRAMPDGRTTSTSLICGELHFSGPSYHPLRLALPACFVVRAAHATPVFRHLTTMLADTAYTALPGRRVLMNKLADILFTLAVCEYAHGNVERRGLFAALTDTRICKVLQAVHNHPGHAWTMRSMAALACMSRSAFAQRFAQLMQMPPMQYVTQWRVCVAERLLRDQQLSVASIAEQLGYQSEAAFRRLFKRIHGVGPGQIRAEAANLPPSKPLAEHIPAPALA